MSSPMSQYEHGERAKGGAGGVYPSVFTVEGYTSQPPPLPPRPSRAQRPTGLAAQTLLFLLVTVALGGLVIEGFFIYSLHQSEHKADSATTFSKHTADEDDSTQSKLPIQEFLPSKPVAQLTGGSDAHHGKKVMGWSMAAEPLLYEISYVDQGLVIQKEGYYFVFSKVFYIDSDKFYHSIEKRTPRYTEGNITLLQSRNYSPESKASGKKNSFLGGVFHLEKRDILYVTVTNTTKLCSYKAFDNMFGAFML